MLASVIVLLTMCHAAQAAMFPGHSRSNQPMPTNNVIISPTLDYNTAYVVDLMLCYSINGYPCKGTPGKYYNHISCLSKEQVCDGITQCPYGDDESGTCGPMSVFCRSDQIRCSDGKCANQCDGVFDCMNNEDERGCPKKRKFECDKKQLMCSDFTCAMVCDGKKECPFGEDETNCLPICKDTEKYCRENNKCILKQKKCPGEPCDPIDIYETLLINRCATSDQSNCLTVTEDADEVLACIDPERDTYIAQSNDAERQYRGCTSKRDFARCLCVGKGFYSEECVERYYYRLDGARDFEWN